jgi:alpha 1,3-glucosidase
MFGDAKSMVSNLTAKGRRLITIIDPHIKKDSNYHVYNEGVQNGYFTKDTKDTDFEGLTNK